MPITRRELLKAGASAAALAAVAAAPRPLLASLGGPPEPVPPIEDPRLRSLVARALDAARSAGAGYADVRLERTRTRQVSVNAVTKEGGAFEVELLSVGARALVDGYWGFASGTAWRPDEVARLGREAVHQAKANALGKVRIVELAPLPAAADGHWTMPVKIDPFEVSPLEIVDYLTSLSLFLERTPTARTKKNAAVFHTQDKAFGSTDGGYCTQRTFRTSGDLAFSLEDGDARGETALDVLGPAGAGWEHYRDQPLREEIRRKFEAIREDSKLPVKPVDVGRYDTVFDAASMAAFVHGTLRPATELDRALGYEANAGGTSYLNDPLAMVGTYQAGGPLLGVAANRSEPGGCATVKWDDEGVEPDDFTLVKDGVLTDFQTTRESAAWLRDYYTGAGRALRSHGCASAPRAVFAPIQHSPNLAMASGRETLDFDALVAGVSKGLAMRRVALDMDFQGLNGLGSGATYEIKGGKRVARVASAGFLFRSPELWKGLLAIGGPGSARRFGMAAKKGEPEQEHYATVTAPPATIKQLTVVDPRRKA